MAATMATVNVVPVVSMGSSFKGQPLIANRGVSVAVRRPLQIRSETNSERYARKGQKNVEQTAGQAADEAQSLGKRISNQVENLKNRFFGAGDEAQKEAQGNLNQARNAAGSSGKDAQKKAGNAFADLQSGFKDVTANVQGSLKGSQNAAASTGKDAEQKAGNALENLEQGLKDAVKQQQETVQNKKDEILKNKE